MQLARAPGRNRSKLASLLGQHVFEPRHLALGSYVILQNLCYFPHRTKARRNSVPWEPYLTLCREFVLACEAGEGRGKALKALEDALVAMCAPRKQ